MKRLKSPSDYKQVNENRIFLSRKRPLLHSQSMYYVGLDSEIHNLKDADYY